MDLFEYMGWMIIIITAIALVLITCVIGESMMEAYKVKRLNQRLDFINSMRHRDLNDINEPELPDE